MITPAQMRDSVFSIPATKVSAKDPVDHLNENLLITDTMETLDEKIPKTKIEENDSKLENDEKNKKDDQINGYADEKQFLYNEIFVLFTYSFVKLQFNGK